MIVELLLRAVAAIVAAVLGLLPHFDVPSWMNTTGGYVAVVVGYCSKLGAWVPWGLGATAVACVLASILVTAGIKGVRIALSYITAGGGSAG